MAETRKLTILQVLPSLESGGVERGTLEVGKYLAEQGHRSIVMSAGGRLVKQLEREGSEHVTWEIGAKRLSTLRLVLRLRRFLTENRVDILHARSRMPAWICYLAWKGMDLATRPCFVTTVHGPYSINAYSAVMTKGERVIVISEMIRDYVLKNYADVDPAKLRLIYRGVDPVAYPYGYRPTLEWLERWYSEYPETRGKQLLTLPARITRWKGQEDFIDLIARLRDKAPNTHGLIVGETKDSKDHFLAELQSKAAAVGIANRVTFTGHRSDLRDVMAISTIVYSLAREPEAFGRTTLEALSLGVPVIGYNHGGVAEQLRQVLPDGAVAVRDIAGATHLSERWLVARPQVPIQNDFTLQRMLESTLRVYCELTTNRRNNT